jgi:hypothetical protein
VTAPRPAATPPTALLDQLDALHAAATPGPWFAWDRGVGWHIATEDPAPVQHLPGRPTLLPEGLRTDLGQRADAELIVAAVNVLPQFSVGYRNALAVTDAAARTDSDPGRADDYWIGYRACAAVIARHLTAALSSAHPTGGAR